MDVIKSSTDISRLFNDGRRVFTSHMTLIVLENRDRAQLGGRVAFIAGKKLGNAVWRNAAKRRLRAICYETGGPWDGYDVVMMAKSSLLRKPYQEVLAATESALRQGGLREKNC